MHDRSHDADPMRLGRITPTLLAVVAAASVVIAGVSATLYHQARRAEAHAETLALLGSIAEAKASQIGRWHAERVADAMALGTTPVGAQPLAEALAGPVPASHPIRVWLETLVERYGYDTVALIEPGGRVVLESPAGQAPSGMALDQASIARVIAGRAPVIDGVVRRDAHGDPSLRMFVPLFVHGDRSSAPAAVLMLGSNPSLSTRPTLDWWPSLRSSAETLLATRDDDELLIIEATRYTDGSSFGQRYRLAEHPRMMAVRAALGEVGALEGIDYRGVPALGFAARVQGTAWFLLVKEDLAEVEAGVLVAAVRFGLVLLGLMLAAAFALAALRYRLVLSGARRELALVRQREAAESSRRASEARFARAIEATSEGIWEYDAVGDRQFYSAGWKRILGYADHELAVDSDTWRREIHPDDVERVGVAWDALIAHDAPYDIEYRLRRKDGGYVWVNSRGRAVRDASGKALRVTGSTRDVTERRAKEQQLRDSEQLLSAVFGSVPIGVAVSAVESGRFILVNRRFAELLGYAPTELVDRSSLELGIWERPYQRQEMVDRAIASGGYGDMQVALRRKDGQVRTFALAGTLVAFGGQRYLLSSIFDVTEQQAQQRALVESEARYARAIRGTSDGMWEWTIESGEQVVSPRWLELVGHRAEELPTGAEMFLSLLHPDDKPRVQAAVQAHLEHEVPYDLEVRLRHRTAGYRWFRTRGQVHRDEEGQPRVMAGTITDISEQKALLAEREDLQRQVEHSQRMESMGRLAGGVAHDYNNMLAVILGTVELALPQVAAGQPLHDDLEMIRDAAQRSAELTRQLLAFARRQKIAPERLDLNATIGASMGLMRKLAGPRVAIEWRSESALWPVFLDPAQVDQILANLVSNSRDAIDESREGNILIATRNLPGVAPGEPDRVELLVRDDGDGMDEDTLKHLFDPFFTTKARGKGTGLGAATVYGIVKQNGGSIEAISAPGAGTTVRIELPRASAGAGAASGVTAVARADGDETILVVDDEPAIRTVVRRVLERAGYRVLVAQDGPDALAVSAAHDGPLQLVVSDVIMPGMDGKTLCGLLRQRRPALKVVLMSGYTGDALQFDAAAQSLLLQKPFSAEALLEKVRRTLDAG